MAIDREIFREAVGCVCDYLTYIACIFYACSAIIIVFSLINMYFGDGALMALMSLCALSGLVFMVYSDKKEEKEEWEQRNDRD